MLVFSWMLDIHSHLNIWSILPVPISNLILSKAGLRFVSAIRVLRVKERDHRPPEAPLPLPHATNQSPTSLITFFQPSLPRSLA